MSKKQTHFGIAQVKIGGKRYVTWYGTDKEQRDRVYYRERDNILKDKNVIAVKRVSKKT